MSDEGKELLEKRGGHKTLLKFLDETLMDEPIQEAAKYLKDTCLRCGGRITKA